MQIDFPAVDVNQQSKTSRLVNRIFGVLIFSCWVPFVFGSVANGQGRIELSRAISGDMDIITYSQPQTFLYGSYMGATEYWQQGMSGGQMVWDNQTLQAELELTRAQRRELMELKLDFDERVGHQQLKIQKMQASVYRLENGQYKVDKEAQKKLAELQERVAEMRAEATEQADKVLLPHQKELKVRLAGEGIMRQSGFVRFLTNSSIQRQLGMDAETKKRISEKTKELEQRLQAEMSELVRKAHDDLLRELDGDARSMAEEMLEKYEYTEKANGIALLQYDRYFMKKRTEKSEDED